MKKIDAFELHEVILNEPTNFHILVKNKNDVKSFHLDREITLNILNTYQIIWIKLFGSNYLDQIIWIRLSGSNYLDQIIWIKLSGSIYLNQIIWIKISYKFSYQFSYQLLIHSKKY